MGTVKPIIVIAGQTATGKTKMAIELARKFNGEIISADSWAVYKGFNIGTAKPSASEQKLAKFHLIDVANPEVGFSAVEFKRLAQEAISEIQSRGKIPIICGGTGLYIDSVAYNYQFLPVGREGQREELSRLTIKALLDIIKDKNYDLEGIDTGNKRRLIRLIETNGAIPSRSNLLGKGYMYFGIKIDSNELSNNIVERVNSMIEQDLESEVRSLSDKYGWEVEPMKGIGYQEWRDYIQGSNSLLTVKERIVSNTKSLAKRQMTWFKRNEDIIWVNNFEQISRIIQEKV